MKLTGILMLCLIVTMIMLLFIIVMLIIRQKSIDRSFERWNKELEDYMAKIKSMEAYR